MQIISKTYFTFLMALNIHEEIYAYQISDEFKFRKIQDFMRHEDENLSDHNFILIIKTFIKLRAKTVLCKFFYYTSCNNTVVLYIFVKYLTSNISFFP